ncbi:MAG: arginine decarboxylase [Chitinophagales bacterium]|nr:arginine decarboxylase [Chitinophagales bacterium]MDW8273942.1 arginine decarboxylase [Chitinophagales bacterium]
MNRNLRYRELIEQTFDFPQREFDLKDNTLRFNGLPLMEIIEKYGTPLRITYLPKIGQQIQKARRLFHAAITNNDYKGNYIYCYCTKSNHFSFVVEEALKNKVQLETSSAFDFELIKRLEEKKKITKDLIIICNGFKPQRYIDYIMQFLKAGYKNIIPVMDNTEELDKYPATDEPLNIGIRIAAEEEPKYEFYTSRLGIGYKDIIPFFREKIQNNPAVRLKMLHFFIDTGIKDVNYYWTEFHKSLKIYCEIKKVYPELTALNLGGGMPIKQSLAFDFDYEYMINEIVAQIKSVCTQEGVDEPDIYTEFGSFTVGESGCVLFGVLGQKQQNDRETWYMLDGSLMNNLPDIWGLAQRFIMLPVNLWDNEYKQVNLGGITCDVGDYYNSDAHINQVYLPQIKPGEKLYIGFFNTGAYQDTLSGYGGIKHCLLPSPPHILVDEKKKGKLEYQVFAEEQSAESMMKILGY